MLVLPSNFSNRHVHLKAIECCRHCLTFQHTFLIFKQVQNSLHVLYYYTIHFTKHVYKTIQNKQHKNQHYQVRFPFFFPLKLFDLAPLEKCFPGFAGPRFFLKLRLCLPPCIHLSRSASHLSCFASESNTICMLGNKLLDMEFRYDYFLHTFVY